MVRLKMMKTVGWKLITMVGIELMVMKIAELKLVKMVGLKLMIMVGLHFQSNELDLRNYQNYSIPPLVHKSGN